MSAARPTRLTVLYDAGCPLCSRFRDWLIGQLQLVPLDLVPAGSAEAYQRLPGLDHRRSLEEITVVGDDGSVWTKENAWVVCLWATAKHRALAERLAQPALLPLARAAAYTAAGLRSLTTTATGGDYAEDCAAGCSSTDNPVPLAEG